MKRVAGVIGIANDLEVRLPAVSEHPRPGHRPRRGRRSEERTPLLIRKHESDRQGRMDYATKGSAEWNYQRTRAEEAVRRVRGIKGVINIINLKPRVAPSEIKSKM